MRPSLAVAVALVVVPACASSDDGDVGTVAAPIIGGTLAADDNAVVLLASYPTDRSVLATCTATLVAPDVLLTAAHCVDPQNHPGWIFGMFPGADASAYPTLAALEPHLLPISATHAHPAYDRSPPFTADIAVAILAAPYTAVEPLPIRRDPLTAGMVGQPARIVGYGQAVVGTPSSTRRQAATVIDGIDVGDTVRVGDAQHLTCLGDSGGPALYTVGGREQVIGVDSYADNGNCDRPAHFRRTDAHLAFIEDYLPAAPGPDAGTSGPDAGEGGGDDSGGCSTGGGGAAGGTLLALAAMLATLRRSRR